MMRNSILRVKVRSLTSFVHVEAFWHMYGNHPVSRVMKVFQVPCGEKRNIKIVFALNEKVVYLLSGTDG